MTAQGNVFAVRHGETEWSRSGKHTGRTDIPLDDGGRASARRLGGVLARCEIAHALASPLRRARDTCVLAGFVDCMEIEPDLVEWDYGEYEGLTPDEIERRAPGWLIFKDGCPGGETPAHVAARVDRVIAKLRGVTGQLAVFSHGHLLRALAARWLELPLLAASHFTLDTATLSKLGYYRNIPALERWNCPIAEGRTTP
jgi:probable phosphoglycerate mutase